MDPFLCKLNVRFYKVFRYIFYVNTGINPPSGTTYINPISNLHVLLLFINLKKDPF